MRFGDGLRAERERRGIALDDIAVGTRVSLRNLAALESERFAELPGGIFNRGIVRAYARFCGIDEDETVTAYTDALRQHGVDPEAEGADWTTFAENVRRNREALRPQRRLRWAGVVAMMVGVVVLAAGVFGVLVHRGVVPAPDRLQRLVHRYDHQLALSLTPPRLSLTGSNR